MKLTNNTKDTKVVNFILIFAKDTKEDDILPSSTKDTKNRKGRKNINGTKNAKDAKNRKRTE